MKKFGKALCVMLTVLLFSAISMSCVGSMKYSKYFNYVNPTQKKLSVATTKVLSDASINQSNLRVIKNKILAYKAMSSDGEENVFDSYYDLENSVSLPFLSGTNLSVTVIGEDCKYFGVYNVATQQYSLYNRAGIAYLDKVNAASAPNFSLVSDEHNLIKINGALYDLTNSPAKEILKLDTSYYISCENNLINLSKGGQEVFYSLDGKFVGELTLGDNEEVVYSNGEKVLKQSYYIMPADSKDYTYFDESDKYKINLTFVDIKTGKEKQVNFSDYMISHVVVPSSLSKTDQLTYNMGEFKDKVIIFAYEINKDKTLNYTPNMLIADSNTLAIKAREEDCQEEMQGLANNKYLVKRDGRLSQIVDDKGKVVKNITGYSISYDVNAKLIKSSSGLYDLDGNFIKDSNKYQVLGNAVYGTFMTVKQVNGDRVYGYINTDGTFLPYACRTEEGESITIINDAYGRVYFLDKGDKRDVYSVTGELLLSSENIGTTNIKLFISGVAADKDIYAYSFDSATGTLKTHSFKAV